MPRESPPYSAAGVVVRVTLLTVTEISGVNQCKITVESPLIHPALSHVLKKETVVSLLLKMTRVRRPGKVNLKDVRRQALY